MAVGFTMPRALTAARTAGVTAVVCNPLCLYARRRVDRATVSRPNTRLTSARKRQVVPPTTTMCIDFPCRLVASMVSPPVCCCCCCCSGRLPVVSSSTSSLLLLLLLCSLSSWSLLLLLLLLIVCCCMS